MNLKKISFKNFKSLYDTSFEPGRINVFIGANGYGKSTILEVIGLSVEWRQDTERFQYNVSLVPPVDTGDCRYRFETFLENEEKISLILPRRRT